MQDPPPFFIVGCPRSGTTLLRRMLDAHPEIGVAPETHFARRLDAIRESDHSGSDRETGRRLSDLICESAEVKEMGLDPGALKESMLKVSPNFGEMFGTILQSYRQVRQTKWIGEKTPSHVNYIDTIVDWFPEAKFIHLVRDPRGVVNSWKTVPWSSGYRWRDAEVWVEYVSNGRFAEERMGERIHSLTYETLLGEPRSAVERLCRFLEIPFVSQIENFHARPSGNVNVEREPWKVRAMSSLDPRRAQRWRQTLLTHEIAQIEHIAGTEMRRWGYQPISTITHRFAARLRRLVERPLWKLSLLRSSHR